MATVVRAWDRRSGQWRAVKLLAPALARSAALRQRFRKEAEVMARLEHPGLGRVHGLGEERGQLYIELELIGGRSLRTWLNRNGPMPAAVAVQAAVEVCEAVEVAHAAGVIHRDLKPDNILVETDGRCRVVDFGIARLLSAVSTTRTGLMMGSIGFMSPEQMENAKDVDARADVYSVAATLVALVTDGPVADMDAALQAASERLPQGLMLALVRATTSRREHRTPDIASLRRRLQREQEQVPVRPCVPLHIPLGAPPQKA